MDRFLIGMLIFVGILWLPFLVLAIGYWFTPVSLGWKIAYTLITCGIWGPIIAAFIDTRRY